jgi:hypothetical protein
MSDTPVLMTAVEKMAMAGEQAGLSVRDLISLLENGMTVEQLLQYLAAKLADMPVEN